MPRATPAPTARYGWYLYDFGNSILIINGGLYFPQWFVGQEGGSDLLFNLVFALSSVALLVVAPLVGLSADRGKPLLYLSGTSGILVVSGLVVGMAPLLGNPTVRLVVALVGFFVVLVSYQLSLVFYNALLGSVAEEEERNSVSGVGLAWGWVGGIVGILFGTLFLSGNEKGAGIHSILPSALATCVLTAISLILLFRASRNQSPINIAPVPKPLGGFASEFSSLRAHRNVWSFLLAYFLFSDAILTLQNNSTIYMEAVLQLSDRGKAFEFLLILVASAVGSIASGRFVDSNNYRRALMWTLIACAVVIAVTPLLAGPAAFTAAFGILGLLNGAVWNLSRVLFFGMIPRARRNTYFGFYSIFERFSSIIGPLVWGVLVSLHTDGTTRYRVAWSAMSLFVIISLVFLARTRERNVE